MTRFTDLFTEKELQEKLKLDVTDQLLFKSGAINYSLMGCPSQISTKRQYSAKETQLASILAGDKPKEAILQRTNAVWKTSTHSLVVKALEGLCTEENSGYMEDFMEEDIDKNYKVLIVHSSVYVFLMKHKDFKFIPIKEGSKHLIGTYKDIPIIVDDRCYSKESDTYNVYPAYLLKEDSIYYNDYVDLTDPFISTVEDIQVFTTTKKINIVVDGHSFIGTSKYEDGPADSELSNPLNWKGVTDKIMKYNITIPK